ncbi:hypothetical protein [Methanosarcina sp. WWM596]|nr:hypothetical protein [Methanosarcina sp. WWM596]
MYKFTTFSGAKGTGENADLEFVGDITELIKGLKNKEHIQPLLTG